MVNEITGKWYDEAGDIDEYQMRQLLAHSRRSERKVARSARQNRAVYGWFNWYVNRGRITLREGAEQRKQMRQTSWRRAL